MSDTAKPEMGHEFLARLGKTRLRPGGREATEWLLGHVDFTADTRVLEVACNMGTTMVALAEAHGCRITGLDMNPKALEKARANIEKHGLNDVIDVVEGNALALPFPDASFDVVINEAMLTMLPRDKKSVAVDEYFRVLKKGGVLLTHDVMLTEDSPELVQGLTRAINVRVYPLTGTEWRKVFEERGFSGLKVREGPITLMSFKGMIYDEGLWGALRIFLNGRKKENREFFGRMSGFFNAHRRQLNYIAVVGTKA